MVFSVESVNLNFFFEKKISNDDLWMSRTQFKYHKLMSFDKTNFIKIISQQKQWKYFKNN